MSRLFETETTRRVAGALDLLPRTGGLLLLTGPHGSGKSTAVDLAAAGATRPIHRVRLAPCGEKAGPRALLDGLLAVLDLPGPLNAGAGQLVERIAAEARRTCATLVLDGCDVLRERQYALLVHLADALPHLALVASDALLARLREPHLEPLRTRLRLPIQAKPLSFPELQTCFENDYAEPFLAALHRHTEGLWSSIDTLLTAARLLAEKTGRATQELTEDDLRAAAEAFLV